jgi:homoserine dehydrogenase
VKASKEIGVGLIGFGTVGAGVVEALAKNCGLLERRTGLKLELKKIADIDLERDRGVKVERSLLTSDAMSLIDDKAVDIVVELIGGTTIAKDFILHALAKKKPVVTANKALLAEHGAEIFAAAEENNTDIFFEASVGGGIPIVRSLTKGLVANNIGGIHGILNGTCNYILTRMTEDGTGFDEALDGAQKAGYAEADPSLDIDGYDTAHKAAILASLAYGFNVPMSDIQVEGIRGLACDDIRYAKDLGYRIKLLAVIKEDGGMIEVRVNPALIPSNHTLASVGGAYNAVLVNGDIVGETLYYGMGAGRYPTASAVVGDVADAARALAFGSHERMLPIRWPGGNGRIRDAGMIESRYYLRMSLLDKPGILARICTVLGEKGISIASVLQQDTRAGEYVPVVIVTHKAIESRLASALSEIDEMDFVGSSTTRMIIEDFG